MNAWEAAWRLRHVALAASVLMFVLNVVLFFATQPLFIAFGPGELTTLVLGMLYLLPDALFVAMVLESMLAAGGVRSWRQSFLPSGRALLFALAMAPFALLSMVLVYGVRFPVHSVVLEGGSFGAAERLIFAVLYQPAWDWLLLGLIVAPLALRTLALPQVARRPSAVPNAALFGTVVAAVVLSVAVFVPFALATAIDDLVPAAVQWIGGYFASLVLLTPIAAAVGLLLVRRAAQPLEA